MIFDLFTKGFSEEQKERAKECKTLGELMDFAVQEDIELSDEALECVGGGYGCDENTPVDMPVPVISVGRDK